MMFAAVAALWWFADGDIDRLVYVSSQCSKINTQVPIRIRAEEFGQS